MILKNRLRIGRLSAFCFSISEAIFHSNSRFEFPSTLCFKQLEAGDPLKGKGELLGVN